MRPCCETTSAAGEGAAASGRTSASRKTLGSNVATDMSARGERYHGMLPLTLPDGKEASVTKWPTALQKTAKDKLFSTACSHGRIAES